MSSRQSKYRGVFPYGNKWKAQARIHDTQCYMGLHEDEKAAAKAYDAKIRELGGNEALTNFTILGIDKLEPFPRVDEEYGDQVKRTWHLGFVVATLNQSCLQSMDEIDATAPIYDRLKQERDLLENLQVQIDSVLIQQMSVIMMQKASLCSTPSESTIAQTKNPDASKVTRKRFRAPKSTK